MRLALLVTNTDDSAFAHAHDLDDVKFTRLVHLARPDWEVVPFWAWKGELPQDFNGFDGVMVTGSPASVHDPEPWVAALEACLREAVAQGVPIFGACFGHQAIAKALGGAVGYNPGGWQFGTVTSVQTDELPWSAAGPVPAYASHKEQMTVLPKGARVVATGPDCAMAGFVIGNQVWTTQYHPEMTPGFIEALVQELSDELPQDVTDRARASLVVEADRADWAERIARFFERNQAEKNVPTT